MTTSGKENTLQFETRNDENPYFVHFNSSYPSRWLVYNSHMKRAGISPNVYGVHIEQLGIKEVFCVGLSHPRACSRKANRTSHNSKKRIHHLSGKGSSPNISILVTCALIMSQIESLRLYRTPYSLAVSLTISAISG